MDIDELRHAVEGAGISPADYRIMDQPGESTWCIKKQGHVWQVFYSERGTKRHLQRFDDQNAAYGYFLGQLGVSRT